MNLQEIASKALSFLFPERDNEKTVHSISLEEISALPRPTEPSPYITSLFSYKDSRVQILIWEFKYHRNPEALKKIAKLLADVILEDISEQSIFGTMRKNTLLTPIPMSKKHKRERTFSQTELLCEEIAKLLPGEIISSRGVLSKIRETQKQSKTKSRDERLKNLRGAFEANESVRGKHIILIDDVTTTGATINEAQRALLCAGATQVTAYTIAH